MENIFDDWVDYYNKWIDIITDKDIEVEILYPSLATNVVNALIKQYISTLSRVHIQEHENLIDYINDLRSITLVIAISPTNEDFLTKLAIAVSHKIPTIYIGKVDYVLQPQIFTNFVGLEREEEEVSTKTIFDKYIPIDIFGTQKIKRAVLRTLYNKLCYNHWYGGFAVNNLSILNELLSTITPIDSLYTTKSR